MHIRCHHHKRSLAECRFRKIVRKWRRKPDTIDSDVRVHTAIGDTASRIHKCPIRSITDTAPSRCEPVNALVRIKRRISGKSAKFAIYACALNISLDTEDEAGTGYLPIGSDLTAAKLSRSFKLAKGRVVEFIEADIIAVAPTAAAIDTDIEAPPYRSRCI